MPWAVKRRLIYGGGVLLVILSIFSFGYWKFVYTPPSCFDGAKNGDEKGVDCGGSCRNLCTADALRPTVLWSRIFNITGDYYTAVGLAENPNINSYNLSAKYEFRIYDENNKLITVREGKTSVPKGKRFAIFESGIILRGDKPKIAELSFLSFSNWVKDEVPEPVIGLKYGTLTSASSSPKITGTITNDSLENIRQVELVVFVLDGNENVVASSRTYVDNLMKRSSQDFVFTWPKPFNLGVEVCVAPLDVAVLLDRSGSMRSEGSFPPEPFSTVIKTASNFVKNLTKSDQVSVISFGNQSRIESPISNGKESAKTSIDDMTLSTTTNEQTNITNGLEDGLRELKSQFIRPESKKAIILLTDGIPTLPIDQSNEDYPSSSAILTADNIKSDQIVIYTIGLGKNVNEGFLKSISSGDNYYFFAPTKETLSSIYGKIASNLCPKKPNVINVIHKITE